MRTTLDIADDVLRAAKELAKRQGTTTGQVLSELARKALTDTAGSSERSRSSRRPTSFLGFEPFAARGGIVTDELVNQLRESEPD